jgi:hypothetical protein
MGQHFEDTFEFLDEARKNGANVLVHCAGITSSARSKVDHEVVIEFTAHTNFL